jgi:hypothetical protein
MENRSSLRDVSLIKMLTQHFVLGYFHRAPFLLRYLKLRWTSRGRRADDMGFEATPSKIVIRHPWANPLRLG